MINHIQGSVRCLLVNMYFRVDYTLYPGLAEVEYYSVYLSAGDCLYIPYKW